MDRYSRIRESGLIALHPGHGSYSTGYKYIGDGIFIKIEPPERLNDLVEGGDISFSSASDWYNLSKSKTRLNEAQVIAEFCQHSILDEKTKLNNIDFEIQWLKDQHELTDLSRQKSNLEEKLKQNRDLIFEIRKSYSEVCTTACILAATLCGAAVWRMAVLPMHWFSIVAICLSVLLSLLMLQLSAESRKFHSTSKDDPFGE